MGKIANGLAILLRVVSSLAILCVLNRNPAVRLDYKAPEAALDEDVPDEGSRACARRRVGFPSDPGIHRQIQVKDEIVQVCGLNILESESDWKGEILNFLKDPSMKGINPMLKRQSYPYFLIEDELYKKDSQGILLKCLNSDDALLAMTEIHEGLCGGHHSGGQDEMVVT
ncbi:hypothetical protein RND81_05G112700 [Saponaria officinalis]|uniref:Uncharacterized protein n=1 Tax=Saponaria officinalis TaxID=3572 RepID=A0AAW1KRP6_SAPOF